MDILGDQQHLGIFVAAVILTLITVAPFVFVAWRFLKPFKSGLQNLNAVFVPENNGDGIAQPSRFENTLQAAYERVNTATAKSLDDIANTYKTSQATLVASFESAIKTLKENDNFKSDLLLSVQTRLTEVEAQGKKDKEADQVIITVLQTDLATTKTELAELRDQFNVLKDQVKAIVTEKEELQKERDAALTRAAAAEARAAASDKRADDLVIKLALAEQRAADFEAELLKRPPAPAAPETKDADAHC